MNHVIIIPVLFLGASYLVISLLCWDIDRKGIPLPFRRLQVNSDTGKARVQRKVIVAIIPFWTDEKNFFSEEDARKYFRDVTGKSWINTDSEDSLEESIEEMKELLKKAQEFNPLQK